MKISQEKRKSWDWARCFILTPTLGNVALDLQNEMSSSSVENPPFLFSTLKSRHLCETFSIIQQDLPFSPKSFCLLKCDDIKSEPPVAVVLQTLMISSQQTRLLHRERCKPAQIHPCISDWHPNVSLDQFLGDFWAAFPWGNQRHLAAIPCFISAHGNRDSRALPAPSLNLICSTHQAFFNKHFSKVFWRKTLVCRIKTVFQGWANIVGNYQSTSKLFLLFW